MAKLTVYGRLGKCEERGENKEYLSFGVAEPSYKKEGSNEYITPWFNFLIKADSPTAKFLKANAEKIMSILKELNENEHKTVIMVTHDEELKKQGTTLIEL